MSLRVYIGERVRTARKNAGLTQEQLAGALGKSVEMVSNLERGHALTGIETLQQIAGELKVPFAFFVAGFEEGIPSKRRSLLDQMQTELQTMSDSDVALAVRLMRAIRK